MDHPPLFKGSFGENVTVFCEYSDAQKDEATTNPQVG